jgi:pimeloyl-ACP methyl ester carboxylesterase
VVRDRPCRQVTGPEPRQDVRCNATSGGLASRLMRNRPSFRPVVIGPALLVVAAGLALGPRVRFEDRWIEPQIPEDVERWLSGRESAIEGVRRGDEKGIVWADPEAREVTPLSLVYLHGFSADRHEIEPVLSQLARDVGANAFFTRLRGHGRDGGAMAEATVEAWLDDTAEAVAVGARIGGRVVLVGTSTGGTLATWAAARPEASRRVAGLVLISPNYQPKDRTSRVLLYPWGSVVARVMVGPERCFVPENEAQARHWTTCYPTEVLATMMALVEHVRTMELSTVDAPTLVLYSPEDRVVEPLETERVLERMTSVKPEVRIVRNSSDPARHVLAGDIVSPASNDEVAAAIRDFLARIGS